MSTVPNNPASEGVVAAQDALGLVTQMIERMPLPGQPPAEAPAADTPPAPPAAAPTPPAPPAAAPTPPAAPPPPATAATLADRFSKPAETPAPAADIPEEPPVGSDGKPDPRAAHAYAALRSENNKFKREVVPTLEARAKTAEEKAAAILAENMKLKQDLEAREEKIGMLSITESQQFRQKYDARESGIRNDLAESLVKFAHIPAEQAQEKADALLKFADKPQQLESVTADMHPAVAGATILAAQAYARLDQERKLEIANWRQTAAASGITQAREDVVRSAEERMQMAADALEFAKRSGNPELNPDPQDEQAVANAAELETAFQGWVQTASQDALIKASAEGFAAPLLYARIADQSSKIAALSAELNAFKTAGRVPMVPWNMSPAAPSRAPAAPPPNVAPASAGGADEMAMEIAERAVRSFQAATR